jgi:autotransporter-associated beta strand protein
LSAIYEYIGYSGTGTFIQTGGTNTVTYFYLSFNSDSSGTYHLSGAGQLSALYENIKGTFIQTGGTNSMSGPLSILELYGDSNSSGMYHLSSTGQLSAGYEYIGYSGTGTFTQTGGTNTISSVLSLSYYPGSSGTYNLTGGTLILKSLSKGSGNAAFNFGGGTLKASGSFISSLPMTLTGINGNANIDTVGYSVTLSGILSGTGGLNKIGSGTLTLNALNSYSGDTTVNGGRLEIIHGIDPSGTSFIDVQSGTTTLKTVDVNKADLSINTAPLATFEIVNGSHTVGAISGGGITQLDSGASLTAASISQGTITLAVGATLTIAPRSGLPTATGDIAPVPEPSALTLVAVGFFAAVCRWKKRKR